MSWSYSPSHGPLGGKPAPARSRGDDLPPLGGRPYDDTLRAIADHFRSECRYRAGIARLVHRIMAPGLAILARGLAERRR
jgi:hypothetical protein